MKARYQLYFSNRNLPLVCAETSDKPILTIENYCKWYGLSAIYPDGTVKAISYDDYSELEEFGVLWYDHCLNPKMYQKIANHLGMYYCEQTLEIIIGRYCVEVLEEDHES